MIKKRILQALQLTLPVLLLTAAHAAGEQQDSAQQALQQLKMLQQRLSNGQQSTGAQGEGLSALAEPVQQNEQLGSNARSKNTKPAAAFTPPAVASNDNTNQNANPSPEAVAASDEIAVNDQAYDVMTSQLFPLTPQQLVRLKQQYQTQEFAQASPVGTPPKPTATSQFVDLSPGSTPPVIRLAQGFVSSLVFLDSTGAPWPINAYDLGDPSSFNIQWDKTSNTLMIQAMKLYNYGNLAVRLKGLNTPVMLTLIPGQKAVDYRVDLRVQGYGPNANRLPLEEGIPAAANDVLLHVLDGVPPAGSSRLMVSGGDAQAWLLNGSMFVRTNLTILSPGWIASMTSADGTHAYEMQKSPVLLVSWHGKVMQLKVEGL